MTNVRPQPPAPAAQDTTARISLSLDRGTGLSDGAWWPHTLSLQTEIPALDLAIHERTGARIARVAYTKGLWEPGPHKLWTTLGMTKLGWFERSSRPENIDLSLTDYTHLVLTVIPPGTDSILAELILRDCGHLDDAASATGAISGGGGSDARP